MQEKFEKEITLPIEKDSIHFFSKDKGIWFLPREIRLQKNSLKFSPGEDTAIIERLASEEGLKFGFNPDSKSRINAFS